MEENVNNDGANKELDDGIESDSEAYKEHNDSNGEEDLNAQLEQAMSEIAELKESVQRAQADLILRSAGRALGVAESHGSRKDT